MSSGGYTAGDRGYTLIDFTYPKRQSAGWDEVVRFMEYVRQHFHSIVPGVAADCEVDLFAGGSAHNPGRLPFLGLHSPPHLRDVEPRFWDMIEAVNVWSKVLSDEQFWQLVRATDAPTWAELQRINVHPQHRHDA